MAYFQANSQFSINDVDLKFYIDNITGGAFEEDSNQSFFGTTYPDRFYVIAQNGSEHLRLDIYGQNIVVQQFLGQPVISGGTISAVGEFDMISSTQRWYATGFSASASTTFNAALSASTNDDIAVIQGALSGADTIVLSAFADAMGGYNGDDSLDGGGGNDELDGGAGTDTAVLHAAFAQATIAFEGNVLVVTSATDGTDRLSNFEFVSFNGDVRSVASLMPANDPPVPSAATATAIEDGVVVSGQLQATDTQGDTLTFSHTGAVIPGLTINQNGSFSFNPSSSAYQQIGVGETQQVVATFTVSDGKASASSTLTITVTGVNDAPSFALSQRTLGTIAGQEVDFLVEASDPDGDALTYASSSAAHGTLVAGPDGAFTYSPAQGFSGSDSFTIQATDGHGGSATQSFTVTVSVNNANPVISPTGLQIATTAGMAKAFAVTAIDPDGDALTYSAADPAHGNVTGGGNGQFTYTPDSGYTGTDIIQVTVTDGRGGSASKNFTVSVAAANSPPIIAPVGLAISTMANTAKTFSISASDPNGDALNYTAADPAHGTVSGGTNGTFLYTPDSGFAGIDNVIVTVTDGKGGSDVENVTVSVGNALPLQREFSLLASGGFKGSVGGYGNLFGTSLNEDITVVDRPSAITLDPSFNKGGDIVRLHGNASEWQISRAGSTAILSDGDTFIEMPTGTVGTSIKFDDGIRVLRIDVQLGSLTIGTQAFGETNVQITAAAQNVTLPAGADPEAFANLLLQPNGDVIAGGVLNIFGTSAGHETVNLLFGAISFDPSFNKGGDLVVLSKPASSFTAAVAGTAVFLTGNDLSVGVPAGVSGIDIEFSSTDVRTMLIDREIGGIVLGEQLLGPDPIALAAAT